MYIKRLLLFIFIILLILSLYNDFQKPVTYNSKKTVLNYDQQGLYIKVNPGDTVLSITESINHSAKIHEIGIEQVLHDFQMMNDTRNNNHLINGHVYKFPVYK